MTTQRNETEAPAPRQVGPSSWAVLSTKRIIVSPPALIPLTFQARGWVNSVINDKKLLAVAAFVLMSGSLCRGDIDEPLVGQGPPALGLETILQAPPGMRASWASLKGKVVVLEFWATWCGPCVAAISHLNQIADQFKDQPVQFIAVTEEKEQVVAPFLKKKSMHAWVGLATDGSMFKDFGIDAIPHTVVVDREGKIVAITHPSNLTAQHIKDVLAGKKPGLAQPGNDKGIRAGHEPEPLFQVLIRPTETTSVLSICNPGSLRISGSSVLDVLAACCDVRATRIFTNASLPEGRFEFIIKAPSKQTRVVHDLLRQAVENAFGLTTERETREMDVFVLRSRAQLAEHLLPTVSTGRSSSSSGGGSLNGVNLGIDSIAANLEGFLGKPVLDETQLTNRYDFQLLWEETGTEDAKPRRIAAAVREQLGLELTLAKRPIEVLVVGSVRGQQN